MISSTKLLRKYKKHERDALLPIYTDHVRKYLLRVIAANKQIIPELLDRSESWQKVGTCHEIALNTLINDELQTHQNEHGKESEYTNHVKAKNISRDRRVKLIWALMIEELDRNPKLKGFKPLKTEGEYINCPVCDETVAQLETNGNIDTEFYGCKCVIFDPGPGPWIYEWVPQNTLNHIEYKHGIEVHEIGYTVIPEKWGAILEDIAEKREKKYKHLVREIYLDENGLCYCCEYPLEMCLKKEE